ncbi:hypothetical protein, partial [uncultured Arthrobacter sp.]|uniref:hypothetical protein n=1 Tax=uncultured Arthrobacter sp. TaxID=114050 RepID=UPI002601EB0E
SKAARSALPKNQNSVASRKPITINSRSVDQGLAVSPLAAGTYSGWLTRCVVYPGVEMAWLGLAAALCVKPFVVHYGDGVLQACLG